MMTAHSYTQPPELVKLLAHDLRWNLLSALAFSDHRVQELVDFVKEPANLVSYHLKQLRDGRLVTTRRSDADGRDVYYSLDLDHLRDLYHGAGNALHPLLGVDCAPPVVERDALPRLRVLFVCSHNSARSQMAEALLRETSGGRLQAYSAGSNPTRVNPQAIAAMDALGIDIRPQKAKSFDQFLDQPFDYVITVCDIAREVCPVFPGEGRHIHWSIAPPSHAVVGESPAHSYQRTAAALQSRIVYFLAGLSRQLEQ